MKKGSTIFLRVAIILIGLIVFGLCAFWLPWLGQRAIEQFPEFSYLFLPILIGLYSTMVPFLIALYQAFKLLRLVDQNHAFSDLSVNALKKIKVCALIITSLYVLGSIYLVTQQALHPGIALIGLTIMFTSVVIAVFSAVLQKLLKQALVIKTENELTI